ncbi:hypothetical protein LINPERHAP2_LOCUS4370 [Linum perenne]
MAKFWRG